MSLDPKITLKSNGTDFTPTIHNDTYDFIKPEQFNLKGRSVLITGASKGLGAAVAVSFAKAGASSLGLTARSSLSTTEKAVLDAAKSAGREAPKVLSAKLDVTDNASMEAAAKEVDAAFGGLDILVNNAGFLAAYTPILDGDIDEWWRTWEVNVKGVYLTTRAFLPLLLKKEDGFKTISNVSSFGAHSTTPGASA